MERRPEDGEVGEGAPWRREGIPVDLESSPQLPEPQLPEPQLPELSRELNLELTEIATIDGTAGPEDDQKHRQSSHSDNPDPKVDPVAGPGLNLLRSKVWRSKSEPSVFLSRPSASLELRPSRSTTT